jgi:hypothetical protein
MTPCRLEKNQSPGCQRIFARPSPLPHQRRLNGKISRQSRAGILSVGSIQPNNRRHADAGSKEPARCLRPANAAPAVIQSCHSISTPPSRLARARRLNGVNSRRSSAGTSLVGWTQPNHRRRIDAGSRKPARCSRPESAAPDVSWKVSGIKFSSTRGVKCQGSGIKYQD